mmetsp:Transcript_89053/g.191092  ORF Transcript_89053/g.191092 Transcript_89053/m.191092 type:complete len:128 (-) Transcript_89053:372-755(-)
MAAFATATAAAKTSALGPSSLPAAAQLTFRGGASDLALGLGEVLSRGFSSIEFRATPMEVLVLILGPTMRLPARVRLRRSAKSSSPEPPALVQQKAQRTTQKAMPPKATPFSAGDSNVGSFDHRLLV